MSTTGLWAIPHPFLVSQLLGEGAGHVPAALHRSRRTSPLRAALGKESPVIPGEEQGEQPCAVCVCVPRVKAAAPLCQHDTGVIDT